MPARLDVSLTVTANNDIAVTMGAGTSGATITGSMTLAAPTVSETYAETLALTAGTLAIDLTALQRGGQSALDLTGDRVFGYCIKNTGENVMTFLASASNPYGLFSVTGGTEVHPNGIAYNYSPEGFGTVGASEKSITVTGTLAQSFEIILWSGPE